MVLATTLLALFSVLVPAKTWYAPFQPLMINVKPEAPVALYLTDFAGRPVDPMGTGALAEVATEQAIDLRKIYPTLDTPGTYLLYAIPKESRSIRDFVGTPLVIEVRSDRRYGAPPGPMVLKVSPLSYATMITEKGELTLAFYYDTAGHTVATFQSLAAGGYYDDLTFHRIIPSFVLQAGDPRGDGTGGPGYMIDAEFSTRPHEAGVLSMARSGDPNEAPGVPPASEFADSAGSQFFICLDYANTQQLDNRYTAFGKVTDGMDAVKALAQTPISDQRTGRPETPPVIRSVKIVPVTAQANPYPAIQLIDIPDATTRSATTAPATAPVVVEPAAQPE